MSLDAGEHSSRAIISCVRSRNAVAARKRARVKPPTPNKGRILRTGLTRICQLSLGVNLRLRRTSHRDSSLHRRLTGHVGQRRPLSSRPTSWQASLREHAREIRKSSRLRVSLCFIAWAISLWSEDHISGVHYIVERQLLRLADCGLLMFIVGAPSAVGH